MLKLTKKQFKEFKFAGDLRTQLLKKKGKFISPDMWSYGGVTNTGDFSKEYGALIYIPFMTIEDLVIEADHESN